MPNENKTCPKCGFSWSPRVPNPIKCPRCQHSFLSLPKMVKSISEPKPQEIIESKPRFSFSEQLSVISERLESIESRLDIIEELHKREARERFNHSPLARAVVHPHSSPPTEAEPKLKRLRVGTNDHIYLPAKPESRFSDEVRNRNAVDITPKHGTINLSGHPERYKMKIFGRKPDMNATKRRRE